MSLAMKINVSGDAVEAIARLRAELGDTSVLHGRIAAAEQKFFRDYLRAIAKGRHKTARGLGARPTGFFEEAAESPEGTVTSAGVTISLSPRAAFARAFRDITIKPGSGHEWLPIAATAAAYGRRPLEFQDQLKFVPLGDDLAALMSRAKFDGKNRVFYWLKKEVVQKQERELLPSDDAILEIAEEIIDDRYFEVFNKGGQA